MFAMMFFLLFVMFFLLHSVSPLVVRRGRNDIRDDFTDALLCCYELNTERKGNGSVLYCLQVLSVGYVMRNDD